MGKITKKALIFGIIVPCTCLAVGGVVLGTMLGKMVFVAEVDHSQIDIKGLEDDQTKLMKKYNGMKDSTIDEYLSSFKAYELANIGLNKVSEHENVRSVGIGMVLANVSGLKVEQGIRSNYVKVGDEMLQESISASSMVKVAKRFYQNKTEVKYYNGKYKELEKSEFTESSLKETYTLEDYEDVWGRDYTRPTIYIISSKTVLEYTASKDDDNHINVSLELDPFTSVARYVKQMRMMSDLTKDPNFSKVHINFVLDKDLSLLSSHIEETYKTYYMGVWADTTGTLDETRHYDETIAIPGLSEGCDYKN